MKSKEVIVSNLLATLHELQNNSDLEKNKGLESYLRGKLNALNDILDDEDLDDFYTNEIALDDIYSSNT